MVSIILLILGFIFLIKGADIMVDGSSSIARKFGVSSFFIGLTVVAFGTSAPELFISVVASIKESSGIAFGNIIGSNISNTLLILGIVTIFRPLAVKRRIVSREIPFSFLALLALFILVNDEIFSGGINLLNRVDGLILTLLFCIFIYYTFWTSGDKENFLQKAVDDLKDNTKVYSSLRSVFMILLGLVSLTLGGRWIVEGALSIAEIFSINETLIGLTIVAIGTSLPELAASIVAAKKGQTDMAMGNVIGSNIFNILWVLGLSSLISPIFYESQLSMDMIFLIISTIVLILLVFIGKKNVLGREEGVVLIILYILYIVFLAYRQAILVV